MVGPATFGRAPEGSDRTIHTSTKGLLLGVLVLAGVGLGCRTTTRVEAPGLRVPEGDPAAGRATFVRLDCVGCHRVAGDPSLPEPRRPVPFVLGEGSMSRPTDGRLVTAIINPQHHIRLPHREEVVTREGKSRMNDYADVMRVRELIDLVAYLRTAYEEGKRP